MSTAHILTILGMGLVTYLIRLAPIRLFTRLDIPLWAHQALRYVPTAVLTAIIVPELVQPGGVLDLSVGNSRLVAGLMAGLAAWATRNVLVTIGAGMISLWILQALT